MLHVLVHMFVCVRARASVCDMCASASKYSSWNIWNKRVKKSLLI